MRDVDGKEVPWDRHRFGAFWEEIVVPEVSLGQAARVWAKIALLSFGGPAGQSALMHPGAREHRPRRLPYRDLPLQARSARRPGGLRRRGDGWWGVGG